MNSSSVKTGISFGVASGAITTLGVMIGLYFGTYSRGIVLAGILTVAISDAFSDAMGIHFSEETEGVHTTKEIWIATITTFFAKFIVTMSFFFPILFFPIKLALVWNCIWSFLLVGSFTFYICRKQKKSPLKAISEHFLLMIVVIFVTYYFGRFIDKMFV